MSLHEINEGVHQNKRRMRVGRGIGSGQGKTAAKGSKGQKARTGMKQLPIFQGGCMPLVRRIPKRGFTNSFALTVLEVNVADLNEAFEAGAVVSVDALREAGLLRGRRGRSDLVKILGDGELTKKLDVQVHRVTASAQAKIEQAGGTVTLVAYNTPVSEKQAAAKAARTAAKKK